MRHAHKPTQPIAPETDSLWDKKKLAKFLDVSVSTVDQWITQKRGPRYIKVGVLVRFKPADVHEFVEQCRPDGGVAA
jgi:excisionase family DNA binding protein